MSDLCLNSVEYGFEDNKVVVYLFCRDLDGKDHIVKDHYVPYFYVPKEMSYLFKEFKREDIDTPGFFRREYFGKLVKVYVNKPSEVASLRETRMDSKRIPTFEADVLFPLRYLIDKNIKTGISVGSKIVPKDMPSIFRKLYVDIEVFTNDIRDLKDYSAEIIVIGFYDSFTDTYHVLSTKNGDIGSALKIKKDVKMIPCRNERHLLEAFKRHLTKFKPDVFISFSQFDWLYVFNRMKILGMSCKEISRVGVVQIRSDRVKIHGIQFLDIQRMYYQMFLTGSKWETLHAIGTRELGEEKLYREESVYENWISRPERVLQRNLRDLEIIVRLDHEKGLFNYFDAIRRIIGGSFEDTFHKSRIADLMYLRHCHNKFILPSKTFLKKETYQGAIVHLAKKGIYKNIAVFDWSSMYPNIFLTFNMSFETYCSRSLGDQTYSIDDRYFFLKEPRGITCEIIESLAPLRKPFKEKANDPSVPKEEREYCKVVSDAYKSVINAQYGVYAHAGDQKKIKSYRLYFPKVAEATAYVGRILEESLIEISRDMGYEIIYADTDSIFVPLKEDTEEEISFLESEYNRRMRDFVSERWGVDPSRFEVSFDNKFDTLILLSKKRYIGVSKGNKTVKGLEIIRRNTAEFSAYSQQVISDAIFSGKTKEEIIDITRGLIREFHEKPLEEIAVAQNLSKDPSEFKVLSSHLKAFLYSRDVLKMGLQIGKRFWCAYIKNCPDRLPWNGKLIKIDQIAWDEYNPIPEKYLSLIDYQKMIEKTIKNKIDDFLELLGLEWERDIQQKVDLRSFLGS